MKLKLIVYLQFLALCVSAQSVIKGKVLDDKTGQPLPYASVYINYTTIGTNSDDKGAFALNVAPGIHDLVVSFVGYLPHQAKVTLLEDQVIELTVRLSLSPMKEIQITAKRDAQWDKQVEKFTKLFLGNSSNSKLCRILNPWVLSFPETTAGAFTAQATDALVVENLSLGYRVTYELKNFTVANANYLVAGYVRFQELVSNDSVLTKKWTDKRKNAYEGSSRHLFKSIIEQCVDEEQFDLFEDRSNLTNVVRIANFISNLDKTIFAYSMKGKVMPGPRPYIYSVNLPSRVEVHYRGKNANATVYPDVPFPVSWIEATGPILVFHDGTVLNPLKMTMLGAMFELRVADLLPNNYQPEHEVATYKNPLERKPLSKLTYLTEKPYLQTDRSYYYPEEVVWFKGYMNYYSRLLKDSLSHVLYVDLVDKAGNVKLDRRFPITANTIAGDFSLPSYLESGDYTLHAYTRWMLNFDPTYLFKKPIKILKIGEVAKTKEYRPDEANNTVKISTEKSQYEPREKITVTIGALDEMDKIIPANFSVSVTDIIQAVPAANENSIANDFSLPQGLLPDTLDRKSRHLIQYGFDVKGRFVPAKKQKVHTGLLRFVQEESNLEFVMTTEEDGSFYAPNFLLYDTAKLSVVGQTMKGKPGRIDFDTVQLKPNYSSGGPLQIETYIAERPVRPYILDFGPVRILDEVTITGQRIEKKAASQVIADVEVSGDWIRDSRAADVLSALQMKIPGFRVIIQNDGSGFPTKYLLLGSPSSFGNIKTQEPLVLIDNVVVNDVMGGPAAAIDALSPAEIERVEVSKFGSNAAYGARGGGGVIGIHTRRRPPEATTLGTYDKALLRPLPVKGFSPTRKFISPDYSTPEKNIAVTDNRATIYWNPSIEIKDSAAVVSFFAADNATRYRIIVEGVTTDGRPIRGEKIVTIEKLP
ncbi:MAG TPA: carboxypeptidase-like regulatory domain-containing protein [Chryseolinea sp.]